MTPPEDDQLAADHDSTLDDQDALIGRYVERLSALDHPDAEPLDEAQLADIARDVGISDAALQRAALEANRLQHQGRAAMAAGQLDRAVELGRLAVELAPGSAEAHLALGQAHASRWKRDRSAADRQAAQRRANHALALEPESPAAARLLAQLEAPLPAVTAPAAAGPRKALAWLTLAAGAGLGAVVVVAVIASRPPPQPAPEERAAPPEAVLPGLAPSAVPAPVPSQPGPTELVKPPAAPLSFAFDGSAMPDLQLRRHALRQGYIDLEVDAVLEQKSKNAFKELLMEAALIDSAGQVLLTSQAAFVGDFGPAVAQGDLVPVRLHLQGPETARGTSVRLRVLAAQAAVAKTRPRKPSSPELVWATPAPAGVQIHVIDRLNDAKTIGTNGKIWSRSHDAEWTLTNTGQRSIGQLQMAVRYLDEHGAIAFQSDELHAVVNFLPALDPGEARVVRSFTMPSRAWHSVQLVITKISTKEDEPPP
jgi:tetratricopeptide (TPR) repeat protein